MSMDKMAQNLKLQVTIDRMVHRILDKYMEAFDFLLLLSNMIIKDCVLDFCKARLTLRDKN